MRLLLPLKPKAEQRPLLAALLLLLLL